MTDTNHNQHRVLEPFAETADIPHLDELGEHAIACKRSDEPWEVAHWQWHESDIAAESSERNSNTDSHDCEGHEHQRPSCVTLEERNATSTDHVHDERL